MKPIQIISQELNIKEPWIAAVIEMLDQGSSLPFIARYRKEKTGSMDEVTLAAVRDRNDQLTAIRQRKDAILKSLKERNLITPSLLENIQSAHTLTRLEDLYEKYRPKKKTRATTAREKGLEPLAVFLMNHAKGVSVLGPDPAMEAEKYVSPRSVETPSDALAGARDIIAQEISEDTDIREKIRHLFSSQSLIRSKVKPSKKEVGQKYTDYFDWTEPAFKTPSHRLLAMLRGSREAVLSVRVLPEEDKALSIIEKKYIKNKSDSAQQVQLAVKDGYKRLLSKSIEKESINRLKSRADQTAIQVFADNLSQLLLSAPLGQRRIMAVDPGFRTGCKIVCLDGSGRLLHHDIIFLHHSGNRSTGKKVIDLVKKYRIEAIAIGNGTAGRETETFIKTLDLGPSIQIIMVDESGASIYSASATAREEFPDHDITVRGAVSIGRRLMDPLAELVKLDPKSIGVGQYQHDVDQALLRTALDDVVVSCVNRVGVEVNTASKELLTRVSGLSAAIAANIVEYRNKNGPFKSRKELLKVPRLGPKAFEQSAGFLRIRHAGNVLDQSGIHPESYPIVEKMARDAGITTKDLIMNRPVIDRIDPNLYRTDTVGLPTLKDIILELGSPGRDPREQFEAFSFDESIHEITDLIPGMKVPGIVTNVTAFGAFVDIGVHQDGLVHISQMADHFVKDPATIVSVRQTVRVTILEVDTARKRISLSLKK
ncbi:MAG: RNA-binding transcriptional accessory protein [Desulfobacterales bacterium]|nr:RNA-binding transcriptional accessory protein [Desulfobacterales bacterium]